MIQSFLLPLQFKLKFFIFLLGVRKILVKSTNLFVFFCLLLMYSLFARAEITFEWRDFSSKKGLKVTISTERLLLISISEEDIPNLIRLYQDPTVMHYFRNGELWTTEYAQKRTNIWLARWESNDPRSSFSVFLKEDPRSYIGNAILGVGDEPGRSEMAYLFFPEFWNQGYAFEATSVLVNEYAPLLVAMDYDFSIEFPGAETTPLLWIDATASPENTASHRILDKLGFTHRSEDLPLIKKDEPVVEQWKNYNQEVEGGDSQTTYVRTIEKKYGVIKWHFKKKVSAKDLKPKDTKGEPTV